MEYQTMPNGNLHITASEDERRELLAVRTEQDGSETGDMFSSDNTMYDLFESLIANSELQWTRPEYCGALTDAPMLAIYGEEKEYTVAKEEQANYNIVGGWDDKTWYAPVVKCWAYMGYQVKSPQYDLLETGLAVFTAGN